MTHKTRHTIILMILLTLIISIAPAGLAQDSEEPIDNADAEVYIEAWNTGDTGALMWLLTDDHITQTAAFGEVAGGQALDALIANTRTAMPDYAFTVESMAQAGNTVYVRATITGTHTGPLMLHENLPIIPSGNAINVRAMLTITLAENMISRVEWLDDTYALMTQMGAAKFPADVLKERRNTEVIQTWVDTINTRENAVLMEEQMGSLYRENMVRYTPNNRERQIITLGKDYGEALYLQLNTSFQEAEYTVISITATGDYVTMHYEFSGLFMEDAGTHHGGIVKATGEEYSFDGATVFRLEDGLIIEEWWYWDNELFAKVDYGYAD